MSDKSPLTLDELAGRFEGLGDNCELGLVQRCCGAEPLGLFRFSGAGLENMIHVIATGGSHLFTEDDVLLSYDEAAGEYFVKSKYYDDFLSHTRLNQKAADETGLRHKRVRALAYLKDRFFDAMSRSEKVYVRKGAEGIADMRRLHEALGRPARNTLLWVVEADRFHEAGTIEAIGDGLWRGYVRRFKRFTLDEPIDLASWVAVLRQMGRTVYPQAGGDVPTCLARGRMRRIDEQSVALSEQQSGEGPAVRLELLSNTGLDRILVSADIDPAVTAAGIIVASVRVKIEHAFAGNRLDAHFTGLSCLHSQPADLEQRDVWQTIWVTADCPAGSALGVLGVRGIAGQGSRFSVGDWAIETGPVPGPASRKRTGGLRRLAELFGAGRHRATGKRSSYPKRIGVLQKAELAMAEGRFIEADDMLSVALAETPGEPALLKQYAFSAHNSARYGTAIIRWQQALQAAPHDAMCHAGVAANFREFGEVGIAANVIAIALERFPDDGTVLTEAARIAEKRGRPAEALPWLDHAIDLYGPLPHLVADRDRAKSEAETRQRRADLEAGAFG